MADKSPPEDDRRKLLDWLNKHEETSGGVPAFSPGTGMWLLETPEYRDWRTPAGHNLLWCVGAPGAGKSALAAIATQDLINRYDDTSVIVASYFCDFAAAQQQDTTAIVQSLLRQVIVSADARQIPALLKLQTKAKQTNDLRVLEQMLTTVCEGAGNVSIVFDAPDELIDPTPILALLDRLVKKGCKVFVTSRHMGSNHANLLSQGTQIAIGARHDDIARYVQHRLEAAEMQTNTPLFSDMAEAIATKVNGIFLLARILVDELLQMTTIKKMRRALADMPSHLEEAYASSLIRIEDQPPERRDLAHKVIIWVTHACRRLSVDELQHALALEDDDVDLDEDNIPNLSLLVKICAGIVLIGDDGKVGMVHTTAYEYFKERFHHGSDERIGKTLLHYLQLTPFQTGACDVVDDLESRLSQMPLLRYAASHWADHVRAAQLEMSLAEDIRIFMLNDNLRSAALQAARYKKSFKDKEIASEYLASVPIRQSALHAAAYWDLPVILQTLCASESHLNEQDSQNWTPLHWACHRNSATAINILVAAGADVNAQDSVEWTPLFWCAFNGDVTGTELLVQQGARYTIKDSYGWTPLAWAAVSASSERLAVVNILLNHYAQDAQDATFEQDATPLDLAEARGDSDLFKVLLTHPQDLSVRLDTLWSSGNFDPPVSNMWRAAHKGEAMYGINYDLDRSTPLLISAIKDGKRTIMRALLELGASVNELDSNPIRPPLHWAVYREDTAYVRDLLDAGADVTALDVYGQTALFQAVVNGHIDAVKMLVEAGSNVNVARPFNRNYRYRESHAGQTPLMVACGLEDGKDGDTDAVGGIAGRGADCTLSNEHEKTAADMVALLLSYGGNAHAVDDFGQNVMRYGIMSGKIECVNALVAAGATFEGVAKDGTTALHEAVKARDLTIMDLVIRSGPDLNASDQESRNVFHHLVMRSKDFDVPIDEPGSALDGLLSKCHADMLNAECPNPWSIHQEVATPLSLAFASCNWSLAKTLYDRGATLPDDCPTHTWLRDAVNDRNLGVVKFLLEMGIKPNETNWTYFRGIPTTAGEVDICRDIITELLNAGLEIGQTMNQIDRLFKHLRLPLWKRSTLISLAAAAEADDASFVQFLLDHGADPRHQLADDPDAFRIAAIHGNWNTLTTLLRWLDADERHSSHWAYRCSESNPADDVVAFCQALKKSGEVDKAGRDRQIMFLAVERRNDRLVSALLDRGANANDADEKTGLSVLHDAAFRGQFENVCSLIQAGADVNATMTKWHDGNCKPTGLYEDDPWQGTPLHLAAMMGYTDVVKALIANGANVHARTEAEFVPSHGPTALHLALSTGTFYCQAKPDLCEERLQIAEMLIAEGADATGVGDHLTNRDAQLFKGHEKLWDNLRQAAKQKLKIVEP